MVVNRSHCANFWRRYCYYKKYKYYTWGTPSSPLTSKEQESRFLEETPLKQISQVKVHNEYPTEYGGRKTTIVELQFSLSTGMLFPRYNSICFYDLKQGKAVYDIIQNAMQGTLIVPKFEPKQAQPDIPALIEALAKLHGEGILSDQEFETKKRELLSRL
jgi:hypothetical protein